MSKMVIKSAILALIGLITSAVIYIWRARKQRALSLLKAEEESRRQKLLEAEWERVAREKEPDLTVMNDVEALESSERLRSEQQKRISIIDQYDLPWSEEHSLS